MMKETIKENEKKIKDQAIKGVSWTVMVRMVSMAMKFGSNVILTWLLIPEAFGLMAIASIFITGLHQLSDTGIYANIIRSPKSNDMNFCNTMWSIQVFRGIILTVICLALSKPLALFYGEPILAEIVAVLGINVFLRCLTSTSIPLLEKRLMIQRIYILEVCTQLITIIVMIVWVVISSSVWGLVAGTIVGTSLKTIISHFMLPGHSNRLQWNQEALQEASHFGRWIFLSSAFNFLATQTDRMLVGKLMSIETLGVYHIGLQLARMPFIIFQHISYRIIYPTMNQYYHLDANTLNDKIAEVKKYLLPGMLFFCLAVMIGAEPFFRNLYRAEYHGAIRVTRMLGFFIWFEMLTSLLDRFPLILGKSKILAKKSIFSFFIKSTCCLLGFYLGKIEGLIVGLVVGSAMTYFFIMYENKRINIKAGSGDLKYSFFLGSIFGTYMFLLYFFNFHKAYENLILSFILILLIAIWMAKTSYAQIIKRFFKKS